MARNKDREFKEFLIAQRKKVGPGYMNTPVWIIQKAGKRIWNRRQKRNWRETEFGSQYRSLVLDKLKEKNSSPIKSGKRTKKVKFGFNKKVRTRNTTAITNKSIKKSKRKK
ncbi:MAG: hypothetical protein PHR26_01945 [Candidatus ainarchaeum sp.]|nr:hypothetical protein [Candidatus ainarchaeum sp.]